MDYIELEIGSKRKYVYLLIDEDDKIWIDFKGLPETAMLCALVDGEPILSAKCGEKSNKPRAFVGIEWTINKWGGPEDFVEALKTRRQMTLDDLPSLREKYGKIG